MLLVLQFCEISDVFSIVLPISGTIFPSTWLALVMAFQHVVKTELFWMAAEERLFIVAVLLFLNCYITLLFIVINIDIWMLFLYIMSFV